MPVSAICAQLLLAPFVCLPNLATSLSCSVRGVEATAVGKARVGKHAFRINVTRQADGRYKYVLAGETEQDSLNWLKALIEEGCSANLSRIRVRARGDSRPLFTPCAIHGVLV